MRKPLITVLKQTIDSYRYLLCEKTVVFILYSGKRVGGDLLMTNVISNYVWCAGTSVKLSRIKSFSLGAV